MPFPAAIFETRLRKPIPLNGRAMPLSLQLRWGNTDRQSVMFFGRILGVI
jgi:hypothetical protein